MIYYLKFIQNPSAKHRKLYPYLYVTIIFIKIANWVSSLISVVSDKMWQRLIKKALISIHH